MPKGLSDQALQKIVGRTPNGIKSFDVDEYIANRPMIEKLYEERQMALAKVIDLEYKVSSLSNHVHHLELIKQRLEILLAERANRSLWAFGISLIATITAGIGVNVVTSTSSIWLGWFLIGISAVLEVIDFLLIRISSR